MISGAARLLGTHQALSEISRPEKFKEWLEENGKTPEEYVNGYKVLLRASFQMFEDHLQTCRGTLLIEANREYRCARSNIADVDELSPSSEAANLIKNLKSVDEDIRTAYDFETLSSAVSKLESQVLEQFSRVFNEYGEYNSDFENERIQTYLSLFQIITFGNETARGLPEGFVYGWFEPGYSKEYLESVFDQYKFALYWIYSDLCFDDADIDSLRENILNSESWKKLDRYFQNVRRELLVPFEKETDAKKHELFELHITETPDELSDLLENAPDPVTGKEEDLNRLFFWDFANRADDVLAGSGAAGFLTILFGIKSVKDRTGADLPIHVRKFKHPTEPGYDLSYAIELSGWTIEGSGTLHGWAVFVHLGTNYSGFGGQQHRMVEDLLEDLEQKDEIEVEVAVVEEDLLKQYIQENQYNSDGPQYKPGESKYDRRSISRIIRGGEDEKTEFKESWPPSADKVGKEIVALANKKGGVLLFGISDDGDIEGVEDLDTLHNRINGQLRDKIIPQLNVDIHTESIQDQDILIVEIPDVVEPVSMDYIHYLRSGRDRQRVTYRELRDKYE